ncbi:MAG: NAD(P)-binding protein [Caulobacterales bacterium]|nr:NAD(P)-binding protein [Caulobacterales bacterium]
MSAIAIIGAGMAACGAARRIAERGGRAVLFDRDAEPGGPSATLVSPDGFVFEAGPFAAPASDARLAAAFADAAEGRDEEHEARARLHWKGRWIDSPALTRLHGLPEDIVVRCVRDYGEARSSGPLDRLFAADLNYLDWLTARYGATYANAFPAQLAAKRFTRPACELTTDWIADEGPPPDFEAILRGALSPTPAHDAPAERLRYPAHGGFEAYRRGFLGAAELALHRRVTEIDPVRRRLRFADDSAFEYDQLITGAPLPQLAAMVADAPDDVLEAARALASVNAVIVNLGVGRRDLTDAHWIDFYDQDYVFTRVRAPTNLSPHAAPEGCGSIQCEINFSDKYKPLAEHPESLVEAAEEDLRRCGLLREEDMVVFTNVARVPHARVIFDHDRPAALETVRGFLTDVGVLLAGRFGLWGDHDAAQAFASGEAAADAALAHARPAPAEA